MSSALPIAGRSISGSLSDREQEIGALVDRFYEAARRDPVLGPIFDANVADWGAHLSRMRDFWSAVVYRTGRYSGRPLDAHRRIEEIRPEHFPRWVRLWCAAVDEIVRSEAREPLKEHASRMALSMMERLRSSPPDVFR